MSLVRLCCNAYAINKEEHRALIGQIWPEILDEAKYPHLKDKIIDVDELPDWLDQVDAVSIKPLHIVRFVKPAPNLTGGLKNPDTREGVKEFVKTVNQIVMPGFELLQYGQIKVLEDSCTDIVQEQLDDGWRIIAVMPQPQARRPDYILVKPER